MQLDQLHNAMKIFTEIKAISKDLSLQPTLVFDKHKNIYDTVFMTEKELENHKHLEIIKQ